VVVAAAGLTLQIQAAAAAAAGVVAVPRRKSLQIAGAVLDKAPGWARANFAATGGKQNRQLEKAQKAAKAEVPGAKTGELGQTAAVQKQLDSCSAHSQ
jgi:hypothetical protein